MTNLFVLVALMSFRYKYLLADIVGWKLRTEVIPWVAVTDTILICWWRSDRGEDNNNYTQTPTIQITPQGPVSSLSPTCPYLLFDVCITPCRPIEVDCCGLCRTSKDVPEHVIHRAKNYGVNYLSYFSPPCNFQYYQSIPLVLLLNFNFLVSRAGYRQWFNSEKPRYA